MPESFGSDYSADITGYHMSGAYGVGFAIQFLFGYLASATTFAVMPFVLIVFGVGVIAATVVTLKALKK